MNKFKLFLFIVLLNFLTTDTWSYPPELKFNNGVFKIVQFTDLHWISGSKFKEKNDSTPRLMENIIVAEKPDLVVITGDIVVSSNALNEWGKLVQPMVRNKVPFAVTFGDHDTETDVPTEKVLEYLQTIPYNLTFKADSDIDGVGNSILPILSSNGQSKKWMLYLVTSFLEKKDVLGVFAGHDHNNDFIGTYKDRISLAYGRKTGYAAPYKENLERGARVIEIYEDERWFDTYIRTSSDSSLNYSFEQKLDRGNYPVAEGTFIQDFLVAKWDDDRWQKEFSILKEAGMKYLIFGPAVHTDKNGNSTSLYPSNIKNVTQKGSVDLIDICLRNAEKAGFKVFIGLNFDEKWWSAGNTPEWLYNNMTTGNEVADELAKRYKKRYPNAFHGWYWVWEVANIASLKDVENQHILARALNINLDHRNRKYPEMPYMLSPYMNYRIGSAKEYGAMWKTVFAKTNFATGDIFSPQDCVGAGGLKVEHLPAWFKELGEAVKTKPGLRFWSNAETFEQEFWTSANIDRFVKQMKLVTPYVSKIISFAYSHYYSPLNEERMFHQTYIDYLKSGKLPEKVKPTIPINARLIQLNDSVHLTWDGPKEQATFSGYYIYKDDVRIGNIQARKLKDFKSEFMDKTKNVNSVYQVSTYNSVGDESNRVQFENK